MLKLTMAHHAAVACALTLVTWVSSAAAQTLYDDLEPGRWTVISLNTIDDVDPCPSQDCSYSAVEGISGVIDDWCGGAFATRFGELGIFNARGRSQTSELTR